MEEITQVELEAYLDEALAPAEMAAIEQALRDKPELTQVLSSINARRDAGVHSIGEIWRRHRVSCPTREQLGSFLLGTLDEPTHEYVKFHMETVGCRFCLSNLEDLKLRQAESAESTQTRRKKYFQSSAGYLKKKDK